MATPPVDIKKLDVLQAQISVSISQTRSLVDSWLPPAPSTAGKSAPLYSALPGDDSYELFKPKPPRLGLGAAIPKHCYDDDQKLRKDISSVDLLKRRLLGSKRNVSQMSDKPTQPKVRYQNGNSRVESESEEEEGRSALGRSKWPKVEAQEGNDVKRQKIEDRKVVAEASTGLGKADKKKDPEEKEEEEQDTPKTSQSNLTASKSHASNGGVSANEPGKKKKRKKKKKNRNKQNGEN